MAITDKEWAEQAALALLANMNLTDMMSEINLVRKKEINLAPNQNGSEYQKNDSIKNEL